MPRNSEMLDLVRVSHESIADPADGLQVAGTGGVVPAITSKTHDEVVDGAGIGIVPDAPPSFQNFLAWHRTALMLHEVAQQCRFHQRQRHPLFPDPDF